MWKHPYPSIMDPLWSLQLQATWLAFIKHKRRNISSVEFIEYFWTLVREMVPTTLSPKAKILDDDDDGCSVMCLTCFSEFKPFISSPYLIYAMSTRSPTKLARYSKVCSLPCVYCTAIFV